MKKHKSNVHEHLQDSNFINVFQLIYYKYLDVGNKIMFGLVAHEIFPLGVFNC